MTPAPPSIGEQRGPFVVSAELHDPEHDPCHRGSRESYDGEQVADVPTLRVLGLPEATYAVYHGGDLERPNEQVSLGCVVNRHLASRHAP